MSVLAKIAVGIYFAVSVSYASAQTIYTTHADGTRLATVNAIGGGATDVGAMGQSQAWAMTVDTNGTLYTTYNGFAANPQLAVVDRTTGAITSTVGSLPVAMIALEIDFSGQMWGVGFNDGILYRIDKSNATGIAVGPTGLNQAMDLSFDLAGNLYVVAGNSLYRLNMATGASTLVNAISGTAGEVMGIMFGQTGALYATDYVAGAQLYSVNPTTGVATVIGPTGLNQPHGGDIALVASLSSTTPVPTLSEWGMIILSSLLALGGVVSIRRQWN